MEQDNVNKAFGVVDKTLRSVSKFHDSLNSIMEKNDFYSVIDKKKCIHNPTDLFSVPFDFIWIFNEKNSFNDYVVEIQLYDDSNNGHIPVVKVFVLKCKDYTSDEEDRWRQYNYATISVVTQLTAQNLNDFKKEISTSNEYGDGNLIEVYSSKMDLYQLNDESQIQSMIIPKIKEMKKMKTGGLRIS